MTRRAARKFTDEFKKQMVDYIIAVSHQVKS